MDGPENLIAVIKTELGNMIDYLEFTEGGFQTANAKTANTTATYAVNAAQRALDEGFETAEEEGNWEAIKDLLDLLQYSTQATYAVARGDHPGSVMDLVRTTQTQAALVYSLVTRVGNRLYQEGK